MFKPNSGRKTESGVWRYFDYDSSVDKSRCKAPDCSGVLKGKNATNLLTHLRSKHKDIAAELDKAEKERKLKDEITGRQQLVTTSFQPQVMVIILNLHLLKKYS